MRQIGPWRSSLYSSSLMRLPHQTSFRTAPFNLRWLTDAIVPDLIAQSFAKSLFQK
jgi:hypothetical protein